jgi:hypothetical protein
LIADRHAFCLHLKATRERKGLPLETIAESTKIGVSLLKAFERGDLSRWPKGIFRRAFIREYAAAIGLPTEPIVREFTRLFPEDDAALVGRGNLAFPTGIGELRLTLASDRTWLAPTRRRAIAAAVDLFVVVVTAGMVAWLIPVNVLAATAVVALIYYPIATLCAGATPASFWLTSRIHVRWRRRPRPAIPEAAIERPKLVFRRPDASPLMANSGDTDEQVPSPPQNVRAASN